MATPDSIGIALSQFGDKLFQGTLMKSALVWTTWIVFGLIIVGFFYALYLMTQYKYRIFYYELKGMGKTDGKLKKETNNLIIPSFVKLKKDYARIIKVKGVSKWVLFKARKKIEPVNYKYITQKNEVYMFRTDRETFIPAIREVKVKLEDIIIDELIPVPERIKFWQQTEARNAATDYMKEGYHKQMMIWATVVIIGLLIFSAAVIWFNLQASKGAVERIDLVASAVNSLKGVGPG